MFTKKDYDELYQIMEESPEKKDLLSRLLASHQMTISTISHEIRNPLTLVYSTLQLIESQHPEVKNFRYWSDMKHDVDYMKLLLEELSSYNNSSRLHISSIDTNTFFRTLSLSFASSLIETDIQFISKIDSPLPPLQGDSVKLREVFLNLLGNARDSLTSSTVSADVSPAIHLSVSCQSDTLTVTVKDNGCGITNEQITHIFEPFITYKKNGTGLGLPLSSRIIHAHQGEIHVASVPCVHTTFTVTLPIEKNCQHETCS